MKFRAIVLLLALSGILDSCQEPATAIDPIEYAAYISGHTSGLISKNDAVRIRLAKPSITGEPGKEIPFRILTFSPPVEGKTYLYAEDIIEFRPDKPWPSGTDIKATFELGKVLDVPDKLKSYAFGFATIKPSLSVNPGIMISFGEMANKMKRIEGSLQSADLLSMDELEKLLKASSPGREFKVHWEQSTVPNQFRFYIDSIPRLEKAYDLELSWDGNPAGIDVRGSHIYEIPSIHDFIYMGYDLSNGEEQCIQIQLSDPMDPRQDLNGLVYFREGDACRLVTEQNIIRLYPSVRIQGERTLILESSIRNDMHENLKNRVEEKILFEELKPDVEFLSKGVIMPDPEGLLLYFKSVSLRAVDVIVYKVYENNIPYFLQSSDFDADYFYNSYAFSRPVLAKTLLLDEDPAVDLSQWNTCSLDLSPLMREDPGAAYQVRLFFRKEYSVYDCGTEKMGDISEFVLKEDALEDIIENYDYSRYQYQSWSEDYDWAERDNPCHVSYYYYIDRSIQKLVLSSTIGVTAKSSDGRNFNIITTDLLTGQPLSDVAADFFNYQNQPVGSLTTGPDGHGQITLESRPYFLKASKGPQFTWLKLDDGSALSYSQFDVGGAVVQKGLKGMIYGERGVWRPGDTLYLTFILDDRANPLPDDHPVQLDIYNSRGQTSFSTTRTQGPDGFYAFRIPTDPDAPTGMWRAVAKVGGASFEKSLKIETIKPNRLKIKLDFNQDILNSFAGRPEANIDVKWLHGAVAPGVRTTVDISFRKTKTAFAGFEKYTFDDPASYFWSEERNIFDKTVDNNGQARFGIDLPGKENSPGMLDATFLVRAFEKGGDFSTDVFTRQFSPFKRYVGIHVPGGGSYREMLETDKDQRIDVATVDWQGKPVSVTNMEVKVYKIGWRWWWNSGEEDLAYYIGTNDAEVVYQGKVSTIDGHGSFNLKISYPDWGRYLILARDEAEGHQAGMTVYFDWPAYVNRSGRANPAGATMLTFSADKAKYRTGEKAVISFPATPGSRALISIESGSKVLSSQWKVCRETEETFSLDITPGMAPNVYVYLSVIQPHKQAVNDLPIRMYGVIPLMVEDPGTMLHPVISMPGELKPDADYTVSVSEKQGKPMTFTIAVVDDGLLDLTRFKTPDPYNVFYAREALGIKTWDMFDMVMGAFGGKLQKALAIGGDEEAQMAKSKKAQRFVPVVRYAGPFTLQKGEKKDIRLHMPNYVGSVRTMVIAGKDGAYGFAENTTPVRKALMVLATMPRVVGPEEEVELPVSVFVMKENIRDVRVEVTSDEFFSIVQPSQNMTFSQTGEQMAYFSLKVSGRTGIGKVRVTAVSGNESAGQEIEIEVRNPNPVMSKTRDFIIEPGQSVDLPYEFFGLPGTNSGQVTFSSLPEFGLDRHLNYLIHYPYGCIEQVTSAAFPQLFLTSFAELSQDKKDKIDRNIRSAINRIAKMVLADGSLSYWPGQSYYSDWGTSYAGHFLLLAENKGYLLPAGLKDKWTAFQQGAASSYRRTAGSVHTDYDKCQAYRLYTLALAQKPALGAMNRLREAGNLSPSTAWILAAAYLYAGKPEAAEGLISGRSIGETDKYEYAGWTYGSDLRDMAFTLEALTMMKKDAEAFRLLQQMAVELKGSYYSTQTTAFCLYAISRFAGNNESEGLNLSFSINNDSRLTVNTLKRVYSSELSEKGAIKGKIPVTNQGSSRVFASITLSGQPLQSEETEHASNLGISVFYEDDAGNTVDVSSLKQGTDFTARVTVEHPGLLFGYENLALRQIFPSGWEIINTRVQDVATGLKEDAFEYRDFRDDRVYTFFNLEKNSKKTFRVRLNAAYAGRYYLPSVSCEAMYENNIQTNTKGRWVRVVR